MVIMSGFLILRMFFDNQCLNTFTGIDGCSFFAPRCNKWVLGSDFLKVSPLVIFFSSNKQTTQMIENPRSVVSVKA